MSSGAKVDRLIALSVALHLQEILGPACERIEIAGSLRRGVDKVGDIELVAVSKLSEPVDLWGNDREPIIGDLVDVLAAGGELGYRLDARGMRRNGERYKALEYRPHAEHVLRDPLPLDLFIVAPPAQWGVIMTIRTGPAVFSHRLVSHASLALEDGSRGVLPLYMRVQDGVLWDNGRMVETPTEESFFAAIGHPWVSPEDRR